jgi:poly-gamma-glutamate synthesis protein (capsule biosynthesis protein)
LHEWPQGAAEVRGFYAHPTVDRSLVDAGIDAVGCANNVTIGADAIRDSLVHLDTLGIAHTGAGTDIASAMKPVVVVRTFI